MSVLPPEVAAELTQLLQALQSPDNSIRSQAEDHLQNNWTATRPEILLMGLAEQTAGASEPSVLAASPLPLLSFFPKRFSLETCGLTASVALQLRSFAAVIFRRIASKTRKTEQGDSAELFISLAPEQAQVIRQKLLESLANESDRLVRNKIGDAVADIARQYSENSQFAPPFLLQKHVSACAYPLDHAANTISHYLAPVAILPMCAILLFVCLRARGHPCLDTLYMEKTSRTFS